MLPLMPDFWQMDKRDSATLLVHRPAITPRSTPPDAWRRSGRCKRGVSRGLWWSIMLQPRLQEALRLVA